MVYQSQKPSSEPSGADPAMIGSGPRMIAAKDAVSKVWAAAAPALPAFAKHLQSVLPPSDSGAPAQYERLVVSVMRDPDRGFCSQFDKRLRITAFRPLANGAPGPLEGAGVLKGDRLVRVGLEKMAGKSLPEAMSSLSDHAGKKVELEFAREVVVGAGVRGL